jgi:hypothetical protein
MAVGDWFDLSTSTGGSLVERWDGSSWSMGPDPQPGVSLNGLSCTGEDACMAVGSVYQDGDYVAGAERWDGTSWSLETPVSMSGTNADFLTAVSCRSAENCVAVGSAQDQELNVTSVPISESWDGTSWTLHTAPMPQGADYATFRGVSCPSAEQCAAAGSTPDEGLVEGWDGMSWSLQVAPTSVTGAGVSCASSRACMMVGPGNANLGGPLGAEAWDGSSWTSQTLPMPSGTTTGQLDAVSCTAADECMAVGAFGDGDWFALIERYSDSPASDLPIILVPPSVIGTTREGQTLSEVDDSWSNEPTDYTYQWEDCDASGDGCQAIPGATAQTYALTGSDLGYTIRIQEIAHNGAGTGAPATSAAAGPVAPGAPSVTDEGMASSTSSSAVLDATINPHDSAVTECAVQWGLDTSYSQGLPVPCSPQPGSGSDPVTVTAELTGLDPGTEYHYRFVAENSVDRTYGLDATFTTQTAPPPPTPSAPTVENGAASNITPSSAKLAGTVDPNNSPVTDCELQWGSTDEYLGGIARCDTPPGSGSDPVAVSASVSGLSPGTTYHYRFVAENAIDRTYGPDRTFETSRAAVGGVRCERAFEWTIRHVAGHLRYRATDHGLAVMAGSRMLIRLAHNHLTAGRHQRSLPTAVRITHAHPHQLTLQSRDGKVRIAVLLTRGRAVITGYTCS